MKDLRWGTHYQPQRKEPFWASDPIKRRPSDDVSKALRVWWVSQALGPSWSHLVPARARSEAGYSRPLLCCPTILTLPFVSECFPWLSAVSVGLHLKPLHYGLACVATFAVLAFAFSTLPPSPLPPPLFPITFHLTLLWLLHGNTEYTWLQQTTKTTTISSTFILLT